MSKIQSGNKTHDDACNAADTTRSAVLATPGVTQAQAKTADITYFRACLGSAIANGVQPGIFSDALKQLGTGGT